MKELRVTFGKGAGDAASWRIRITDGAGTPLGVELPFEPFLDERDYDDLRWYLEEYMELPDGGAVVRAERVEASLDAWGRRLYDAVFGDEANEKLLSAEDPRELTIATDDASLLRLPWELMADESGALAHRVSVRRQLREPGEKDRVLRAAQPLRLLYIVSRPDDTGFIDPRATAQAMLAALDPLGVQVRVDFCRPPTLHRMEEMLDAARAEGAPYHLVHFDGHGTILPKAQIGALCFEKPDDGTGRSASDLVRADRLGTLLAGHGVPLVVLEACRSGTVTTLVFRSVAPRLIQAGVGSVLSMGHAVLVEAARMLLDRFYRELVRGASIGHAVAAGRKALVSIQERRIEHSPGGRRIVLRDWFLPHLYQRGDDHAMLPAVADDAQPLRRFDVFLSHNHADSARVEALARTLVESHGLRVWLDKWECGPGALEAQCERGIRDSRFTVVVGSQKALDSRWVRWEIDRHKSLNPENDRLLPVKFEALTLPDDLSGLLWVDFTDPAADIAGTLHLERLIRGTDAEDARRKRGFRAPAGKGEPGAFPPEPRFGFRGRARELHLLERRLRKTRGLVLHAMGGMGKTALAREAAHWWTRSGLFRDGACFISFERAQSAESVIRDLGAYLYGQRFDQLPSAEQRRRVVEDFRKHAVLLVWDNFESALAQFAEASTGDGSGTEDAAAEAVTPYTDDVRRELAELFRDLTIGAGVGGVLVTCRPGQTFLDVFAGHFELSGLARSDSLWLLADILGRDGLSLSDPRFPREELDPLLDALADHPLSLELVGPYLKKFDPAQIRSDFDTLLTRIEQDAPEGRNRSLLASLEFSRKHLSQAARAALPWLGLFQSGVFEQKLLEVSDLTPEAWEPLRGEFQTIALLRIEDGLQIDGRPYLRFHPTLAAAATDPELAERPETRQRYIAAYLALMCALDKARSGSQPRVALEVLRREEPNYCRAVRWAVADGRLREAAALGETFREYLQRSGRLRERDRWVAWLLGEVKRSDFTEDVATFESQHAWSLYSKGDPQRAVKQLRELVRRLKDTTGFDTAFQLANSTQMLGRVLNETGAFILAIPVLRDAISRWEALVRMEAGCGWEDIVASGDGRADFVELGNLSATIGDLANALRNTQQYDESLAQAEKCIQIQRYRGATSEIITTEQRRADILIASGRYTEANDLLGGALAEARNTGDQGLICMTLLSMADLAGRCNQIDRSVKLYKEALAITHRNGDRVGMMRIYNHLGVADDRAGRFPDARDWYEKSREMAVTMRSGPGIVHAAHNIGVSWHMEGEVVLARGDEAGARRCFGEALRRVDESLRAWQASEDAGGQAYARSQLAKTHLRLGDFELAERCAHSAREIREPLGIIEVSRDYDTLATIAEIRGDYKAAREWRLKRDATRAERQRRSRGDVAADG